MESFFITLAFVFILLLWRKNTQIKSDLSELQQKYINLETLFQKWKQESNIQVSFHPTIQPEKVEPILPKIEAEITERVQQTPEIKIKPIDTPIPELFPNLDSTEPTQEVEKPIPVPERKSAWKDFVSEKWELIEKPLVENWTGILGAMILVAGVGFLGIYAAFIVSPLIRFFMILAVSGVLLTLSIYTQSKPSFLLFPLYLRSSAGAVLLIACIGAFGIEGIKWTDNTILSIFLLVIGVCSNLYIGLFTKKQSFLSLHTILSLIALAFLQNSFYAYTLGSIAMLFAISLNFSEKWDWHLLFSLIAYSIFCNALLEGETLIVESLVYRVICIAFTLPVFAGFLYVHYKNVFYEKKNLEILPFLSHLLSWSSLGLVLLKLSTGSFLSTIFLGIVSISLFLFSRKAKEKEIHWLFLSDKLVSLAIAYLFAYSFTKLDVKIFPILSICAMETILFSYLVLKEGSKILLKIGLTLSSVFGFFLFLAVAMNTGELNRSTILNLSSYAAFLVVSLISLGFFQKEKTNPTVEIHPLFREVLGFITGLGLIGLYCRFIQFTWTATVALVVLSILLFHFSKKMQSIGLGLGYLFSLLALYIGTWIQATDNYQTTNNTFVYLQNMIPLFFLLIPMVFFSYLEKFQKNLSFIGIYLFTIHTMIFTIQITGTEYFYFAGPILAFLSLMFLQASILVKKIPSEKLSIYSYPDEHILYSGLAILLSSIVRNFGWEDSLSQKWLEIPIPYTTKAYLLLILSIWIFQLNKITGQFQRLIAPVFWEIGLFVILFSTGYFSDSWGIFSFAIVMCGTLVIGKFIPILDRFKFYSYILFFLFSLILFSFGQSIQTFPKDQLYVLFLSSALLGIYLLFLFPELLQVREDYPILFRFEKKILNFFIEHKSIVYQFLGIYLGTFSILYFSAKILSLGSNLSVGVIWLSISLLYLETSQRSRTGELSSYYKFAGLGIITLFLFRHLFVDLQSGVYLWILPVRFLIEIFAFAVVTYWYKYSSTQEIESEEKPNFQYIEYLIEINLAIIFLALDAILPSYTNIVGWSVLCIGMLVLGRRYQHLSRLVVYSSYLHVFIMFYIAFVLSNSDTPSQFWMNQNWFTGILSMLAQTFYIYKIYESFGDTEYKFPTGIGFIQRISDKLIKKKDYYLFYPFFASILLFLYWSFDNAILTLLWTIVSFAIFSLSLLLRLTHFRYTALILILFCVFRLIFHDLSSSGTIVKAIVFLGVGSILLLMNSLYNKFKDRF